MNEINRGGFRRGHPGLQPRGLHNTCSKASRPLNPALKVNQVSNKIHPLRIDHGGGGGGGGVVVAAALVRVRARPPQAQRVVVGGGHQHVVVARVPGHGVDAARVARHHGDGLLAVHVPDVHLQDDRP